MVRKKLYSKMYLGDPRENAICPASGTIWEEDNRVEERWFWNGSSRDLCNMNPEDYGKTVFYTSDAPEKQPSEGKNNMTLEVNDEGFGSVSFTNPPASDIYMVIEDEDGSVDVVVIPKDSESPFVFDFEDVNPSKIKKVFIGPDEDHAKSDSFTDDKYRYTIKYKPKPAERAWYAAINHLIAGTITPELVANYGKEAVVKGNCAAFMYVIPPVAVEGLDEMTDEAAKNIYDTYQTDLFILTTKPLTHVFLNGGEEQTESWDLNCDEVTMDGVSYNVSRFSLTEHSNVYDPNDQVGLDVVYTYKIIMG